MITIQTISVGSTIVDLNTQDIRLGRIYFHLSLQMLYANCWDLGNPGDKMADDLRSSNAFSRFTPFSYTSCPLNPSLNGTDLLSLDDKGVQYPCLPKLLWYLDCLALFLGCICWVLFLLVGYYIHMDEALVWVHSTHIFVCSALESHNTWNPAPVY